MAVGRLVQKRIMWTSGFRLSTHDEVEELDVGRPIISGLHPKTEKVLIKTYDGQVLEADEVKIEGGVICNFAHLAQRAGMVAGTTYSDRQSRDVALFHDYLR